MTKFFIFFKPRSQKTCFKSDVKKFFFVEKNFLLKISKSYDMYFQRDFLKSKIEQNAVFGPKYLENGKEWRDQIFYPCRTIARGRKNGEKNFQGQTNKMLKKFKKS